MSNLRTGGIAAMAVATTLLLAAFGAATAAAQCSQAPVAPGNSEIDQYLETIPGACGDQKPGGSSGAGSEGGGGDPGGSSGAGSEGGGGDSVPPEIAAELDSLGSDGAAVADLAATTGPGVAAAQGEDGEEGTGSFATGTASPSASGSSDGSAIDALTRGLMGDSGGGVGILLPVLLIATIIAVLLGVAIRSRTSV